MDDDIGLGLIAAQKRSTEMTTGTNEEVTPARANTILSEVTGGRMGAAEDDVFDVIVIGAGSTGTNVAGYARDNDLSVAIVEAGLVGGECSYWACMPSKALLGPIHAIASANRISGAAAAVDESIDVDAVFARRDEFASEFDDAAQVAWLDSTGAILFRGRGRLSGERRVDVTDGEGATRHLRAEQGVVIATGSRPAKPPIAGLSETKVWTNREATTVSEVPERLIVLGGGVVGCELAQAFRGLGSRVTIVEQADRILDNFDQAVSELVAAEMQQRGINLLTDAETESISRTGPVGEGPVRVVMADGGTIEADELLVATGRRFNTDDLGLESVGLDVDGPLEVDDLLRVAGVDGGWLYAAGDVNGRALLTHQGKYQARCVGDTLAGRETRAFADGQAVPQVVFTDPEIAAVGINKTEAKAHSSLRTVDVSMDSVAASSLAGNSTGLATLVVDEDRDVVVGASFVGESAGELLHAATIAIVGEVPLERLWHTVPAFPTMSEIWLRLLEADRGYGSG